MFPFPSPQVAGGGAPQTWTYNPADNGGGTLSNGNRTITSPVSTTGCRSTISKTSGKWYFEQTCVVAGAAATGVGICNASASLTGAIGNDPNSLGYWIGGQITENGAFLGSVATYTSGDVIGVAVDLTGSKAWTSKNGVWTSGNPNTGTGGFSISFAGPYFPIGAPSATSSAFTIPLVLVFPPPTAFSAI